MHGRNKKLTIREKMSKYSYVIIVAIIIIGMFIAGFVIGISWGNFLANKPEKTPQEERLSSICLTSGNTYEGVRRR